MPAAEQQPPTITPALSLRGMYLRSIQFSNFRSCYDTTVDLQPDLTVLVGENNAGKSSIIDAIRLITAPASGRRTRFFEETDQARGTSSPIALRAMFDDLTDIQRAHFISSLDVRTGQCLITHRFIPPTADSRFARPTVTTGPADGPDADPEVRDSIRHVYLHPLRDAQRELDSPDSARLASLIKLLHTPDEQSSFVSDANSQLKALDSHAVLDKTRESVQDHLDGLTSVVRSQSVGIHFSDYTLFRLARGLRIKMAEAGIDLGNLADSGLGYANLLYIATILLELRNSKEAELTLLLVEEPEAHLHPQLQGVLLDYLREQALASLKADTDCPAGRVQVVVSTHSPNLASRIPIEKTVCVRTAPIRWSGDLALQETHVIAVPSLSIPDPQLRKVSRYLDATRASLLFAKRVLLVEGLAEAMLVPILAKKYVLPAASERPELFNGVTVISIGGVDFEPYLRLLLTKAARDTSILDRVVVLTDADPRQSESPTRKERLENLAKDLGASDRLQVFSGTYTFEADLLVGASNGAVLRTAYLEQRPRSADKWDKIVDCSKPAEALYGALCAEAAFLGKGDFAHSLAAQLESAVLFTVPHYIQEAIRAVLELPTGTP